MTAKIGFPAVNGGMVSGESRQVQALAENIRQRLQQLETTVTPLLPTATGLTLISLQNEIAAINAALTLIDNEISALQNAASTVSNLTTTVSYPATENIDAYQVVIQTTGPTVSVADNTNAATCFGSLGIATAGASAGQNCTVQISGVVSFPPNSFTPNYPVYLGPNGTLVQTITEGYSVQIGTALDSQTLFLQIAPAAKYVEENLITYDGYGMYGSYERAMLATVNFAADRAEKPVTYRVATSTISGQKIVKDTGSGSVAYADNNTAGDENRILGITQQGQNSGGTLLIQTGGPIESDIWSWTPDEPIFLGSNGNLTQTPPSGVEFTLIVGFALTPTSMFLRFREPVVLPS